MAQLMGAKGAKRGIRVYRGGDSNGALAGLAPEVVEGSGSANAIDDNARSASRVHTLIEIPRFLRMACIEEEE